MTIPTAGASRKRQMCPERVLEFHPAFRQGGDMLPNNVATLRKAAGKSQTELATAIGTTLSTMGKLERGERPLHADWIEKIADALGVEPFLIIAPDRLLPTEEQLTDMLQLAQQRLPAGLPYSEWPRAVAAGLRMRLLTLAGDRSTGDIEGAQA